MREESIRSGDALAGIRWMQGRNVEHSEGISPFWKGNVPSTGWCGVELPIPHQELTMCGYSRGAL